LIPLAQIAQIHSNPSTQLSPLAQIFQAFQRHVACVRPGAWRTERNLMEGNNALASAKNTVDGLNLVININEHGHRSATNQTRTHAKPT